MAPSRNNTRRSARLDLSRPLDVAPAFPLSTHRFEPLPTPEPSDHALICMATYGTQAGLYYLEHGVWPRFAAPGCACGLEVWRC
jgi:hypothetical protein